MTEYQKKELLRELAREGMRVRANRIFLRKERLERSRQQLEYLENEYAQAQQIINEVG